MRLRIFCALPLLALLIILGADVFHIYQTQKQLKTPVALDAPSEEVKKGLNQNFTTLPDGSYLSADGTLIIHPFPKNFKKKLPQWRKLVPGFAALEKKKLLLDFRSQWRFGSDLAFDHASLDTGILYTHFCPTQEFDRTIDKLDLDRDLYYVQKRAIPADEYLKEAPLEDAQAGLISLIDLTLRSTYNGLQTNQLNPLKAGGFVDGRAIRVKINDLSYWRKWRWRGREKTYNALNQMYTWLAINRPELLPTYDKCMEEIR